MAARQDLPLISIENPSCPGISFPPLVPIDIAIRFELLEVLHVDQT
jgi:hypothetical protein